MTIVNRNVTRTRTRPIPMPGMAQATLSDVSKHPDFLFGFITEKGAVEAFFNFRGQFVDIPLYGDQKEAFELVFAPAAAPAAPAQDFPDDFKAAMSSILTGKAA